VAARLEVVRQQQRARAHLQQQVVHVAQLLVVCKKSSRPSQR
jgi:hypothetical protein